MAETPAKEEAFYPGAQAGCACSCYVMVMWRRPITRPMTSHEECSFRLEEGRCPPLERPPLHPARAVKCLWTSCQRQISLMGRRQEKQGIDTGMRTATTVREWARA